MAGEEELLGRQAPHSPGGRAVGVGRHAHRQPVCGRCQIGLLKPEDFYLQQNREIYETIYAMFNFSPGHRPGDGPGQDAGAGVWQDASTEYIKRTHGDHAHLRQRRPVCLHRAGQGPARGLATAVPRFRRHEGRGGTPAEILESAEKSLRPRVRASGREPGAHQQCAQGVRPPHGIGPVRQ